MTPQIIYLALIFLGFCVQLAKHGEPRTDHYNAGTSLFAIGIILTLQYWGGFYDGFFN